MEYSSLLRSPSFFSFLLEIDRTIAEDSRRKGCLHCGGTLDQSNWKRAGFGLPSGTSDACLVRHSFLCRKCGQRTTPNSLRWTYYRWFSAPSQFLLPALMKKLSRGTLSEICRELGVSSSLLRRWQRWWRESFLTSPFWQVCGQHRCKGPIDSPEALLAAFRAQCLDLVQESVVAVLETLAAYRTARLWSLYPGAMERLWGIT